MFVFCKCPGGSILFLLAFSVLCFLRSLFERFQHTVDYMKRKEFVYCHGLGINRRSDTSAVLVAAAVLFEHPKS